jgi:hypothetical protein
LASCSASRSTPSARPSQLPVRHRHLLQRGRRLPPSCSTIAAARVGLAASVTSSRSASTRTSSRRTASFGRASVSRSAERSGAHGVHVALADRVAVDEYDDRVGGR